MNDIIFNGIHSSNYNVYGAGAGMYSKPRKRYESYSIPGKNGALIVDLGNWENIDVKFQCVLPQTFQEDFDNYYSAMAACTGYCRLEESEHPDSFRMGVFTGGTSPKPTQTYAGGTFSLTFDCKPQLYLKSGEIATRYTPNDGDSSGFVYITNPTKQIAYPVYKIEGYGRLDVNTYKSGFTVSDDVPAAICYDAETKETYKADSSLNYGQYITVGGDVKLYPGRNYIRFRSDTITAVEIIPRWYEI